MHPFALASANDPATAIAAHAADPDLAYIAGGTDLIGLMKDRAALPRRLLDINMLPDMARIEALPDGGLRRHEPLGCGGGACCAGRDGRRARARGRTSDPVHRFPSPARRRPRA